MARLILSADLIRYRGVIWTMAKHELAARYVGTLGGPLWAIIQPVATVAVFWFVFSVGFKAQGPSGMPFVIYFLCGLAPWLTFNEVVSRSVSAITDNVHLVKKVVFPTEVLPFVYLAASAVSHLVLVGLVVAVAAAQGYAPTLHLLQLPYYFLAMGLLMLGLGWALAALNTFHRDVGQIVAVVLNLWFWLTPIVWTPEMVPEKWLWVFRLNPMFHVVEGYRNALVYGEPFWADALAEGPYWLAAGLVFVLGAALFGRLKPEFADVL